MTRYESAYLAYIIHTYCIKAFPPSACACTQYSSTRHLLYSIFLSLLLLSLCAIFSTADIYSSSCYLMYPHLSIIRTVLLFLNKNGCGL